MKIVMVGAGSVGLVTGACLAELGAHVTCVDTDRQKLSRIEAGDMPIFESGLAELAARNQAGGRFATATGLAAVGDADAVFIAVGTPSGSDGKADTGHVFAAARQIAAHLQRRTVIVTKSTAPVGTGAEIERIVCRERPGFTPGVDFDVASNPEFLREGSAVEDFMNPDRVVIGADSTHAREVLRALHRPLEDRGAPLLFTGRQTAELIKYAANGFLAVKVSFINEIADLCEQVGADVQEVSRGMGLDPRIGSRFLRAGPGFGGSCLPKDVRALAYMGRAHGAPQRVAEAAGDVNDTRKAAMVEKVRAACGGSVTGLTLAVLGYAFKANTDDTRESAAKSLVPALQRAGAVVRIYDPAAHCDLAGVVAADSAEAALEGADACVVVTEWDEFRALAPTRLKELLRRPVIVDLRNLYEPGEMREAGLSYVGVGRGGAAGGV